jgi:hypothetical protein
MLEGNLGKDWSDLWACKDGRLPGWKPDPYYLSLRNLSELDGWKHKHSAGGGRLPLDLEPLVTFEAYIFTYSALNMTIQFYKVKVMIGI